MASIATFLGRFIHALRRAKCMNPIILLDEIDKMASDFRGDPWQKARTGKKWPEC